MSLDLCPWLGTDQDRETRHMEPTEAHVCYARERPADIALDYQARTCLTGQHQTCLYYHEPPPLPVHPVLETKDEFGPSVARFPVQWVLLVAVGILVISAVFLYYYGPALIPALRASATPVFTPSPSGAATSGTATSTVVQTVPEPTFKFLDPTATPTPYPGGAIYRLLPRAHAAGWVASDEPRGNHLGDSHLYAGDFDGVGYHGIFQIDLAAVPRGATIHAVVLEITGLTDYRLGDTGIWQVRILGREVDEQWRGQTYEDVHNAPIQWTLSPALGVQDLAVGRTNVFVLPPGQIRDLEQRLLDEHYTVSFRLDGPVAGENSVFAWDAGYGPVTQRHRPVLLLNVGPSPHPPLPTRTPTPTWTP